jgi:Holliday junction resolvase RusA-like endonuclease
MSKSGHVYTPKVTADYEKAIRSHWDAVYGTCKPFSGPLAVTVSFRYRRPQSHYMRGVLRETAPVHYTQTPDLDNVEKAVLDALNKVAYADDKQIIRKYSEKLWHHENEIELWVCELC